MRPFLLRLLGFQAALVFLASNATAGGVRIVTAAGDLNFVEIQPAVDAAVEGDVLLVAEGSYSPFTIDGKSLSILGVPGSAVGVRRGTVRNLQAHQAVLLAGLDFSGISWWPGDGLLIAEDNQGHVRVQDCSALGLPLGYGVDCIPTDGGPGARVRDSARVVFLDCALEGSVGQAQDTFNGDCDGGRGGAGLFAERSTVALYGCQLTGAQGGPAKYQPGGGGRGLWAVEAEVFASAGFLHGGPGGAAYGSTWYGDGGDGAWIDRSSTLRLLDCEASGGFGYPSGAGVAGLGTLESYPTAARGLETPLFVASGEGLAGTYRGEPGDAVWMAVSGRPDQRLQPALSGVRLVRVPNLLTKSPLGIASPLGTLDFALPPVVLWPGAAHRGLILQGLAGDTGLPRYLSGARHALQLSRKVGPDCDGNGVSDYLDVILGTHPDLNHNLVPDPCEP